MALTQRTWTKFKNKEQKESTRKQTAATFLFPNLIEH